ncbi:MAG TPA: DUF433 domain-containing protein [Pseudonocardiaceae bacterium]|nr:DUF433 domain-containing protein [Pseudonocardiaceae bacterium]
MLAGIHTGGAMVDERLLAVTRDTAAKIARLSLRQVDYWAKTDLVPASIDGAVSASRRIHLYSFLDLLALSVAAELKQRGVSLQHIRQIVRHLKSRGYDRPLTQLAYATIGKQVYFQLEDGTWEGGLRPDQIVLHEVLNLRPIRDRITEGVHRDRAQVGRTERRRGALGSKPVLAGTRIPVDTVRRYLQAGRSEAEVLAAYPDLTEADLEVVRRDMAV